MKKYFFIGILLVLFLLVIFSLLSYRWNIVSGFEPALSRFWPQIKFCHLGGMPPGGGSHCHWVWEIPHFHPE